MRRLLERLEHANLFLVPLDSQRVWYRYHSLFSDFLKRSLRQAQPERWKEVHLRAVQWFEQNRMMEEAVMVALSAEDFRSAARLIGLAARRTLERQELSMMMSWLKAMPHELVYTNPRLCGTFAWALAHSGYLEEVEPLLQTMERRLVCG